MNFSRSFWILTSIFFALSDLATQSFAPLPAPGRVHDGPGVLSAEFQSALRASIAKLEDEKGSEVAVVIVESTAPETIEQYALRLAQTWGIGRAKIDDGVLLLVAHKDRKLRIEVGYGLEGALPDAVCRRIIDDRIAPEFRQGDFEAGIAAGTEAIFAAVRGEALPAHAHAELFEDRPDPWLVRKLGGWDRVDSMLKAWMAICAIAGLFLLLARRHLLGVFGAPGAYAIGVLLAAVLAEDDYLFWLVPLVFYWVIYFFIHAARENASGGSFRSGSYSGSSSGSSYNSSSSYGGSSSTSYGGGSFGGGGASGSW